MDIQSTETAGAALAGSLAQREGDTEFALEFIEKSNSYRAPFLLAWPELLDNYMVSPLQMTGPIPRLGSAQIAQRPDTGRRIRSVLKDPETHQIVESQSAQALGLLFGSRNYLQAVPIGSDDYAKSVTLSRILMSVLEGPGVYRTLYETWKDGFTLGTSILELGWEVRSRQQVSEVPMVDDNGAVVGFQFIPQETVYREGPLIQRCDGWDFYPDPSGTRIQHNMLVVGKRFRMTRTEAVALAEAGKYDKAGVGRAIDRKGPAQSLESQYMERFYALQKSLPDRFGTMIGFELWGEVPFKHSDGATNRVITILNGEIVRSTINPHRNGAKPFKEIVVNPIPGRFYGMSTAEVNRFLQDSADQMLMLMSDAADEMVRPQLLVGDGFNGDLDALKRGDKFIECRNKDAVGPIPRDYNALQLAAMEYQRRKMSMRESSGMTNPMQGMSGSDRQTATEFSEIVRLASQRVEMMVQISERDDFPFIGKFIHCMLRQFLDDEGVAILNGEPLQFSLRDIDYDADVRFVGSRQAQSKFQKLSSYERAISVIGPNLQLIPAMPELFIRHLRDGLEIPDAERIIAQAVAYVSNLQQQQQLQQSAATSTAQPPEFGSAVGQTEAGGQRIA